MYVEEWGSIINLDNVTQMTLDTYEEKDGSTQHRLHIDFSSGETRYIYNSEPSKRVFDRVKNLSDIIVGRTG
jgi:hypothetical protein